MNKAGGKFQTNGQRPYVEASGQVPRTAPAPENRNFGFGGYFLLQIPLERDKIVID